MCTNSVGESESMRPILVEFNFIIHIARYMYSETENICPSFVTLEHFMFFSKIKKIIVLKKYNSYPGFFIHFLLYN